MKSQATGEPFLQVENIIKDFAAKIGTMYTFEENEVNKEEADHFPYPRVEKKTGGLE